MTKNRITTGVAAVAIVLIGSVGVRAQDTAIERESLEILEEMLDYVGSQNSFSVSTETWSEDVMTTGQKLQFGFANHIVIQRPNKLHASFSTQGSRPEITYDGESLTIFQPEAGYYAVSEAPDNLDDLLHHARDVLDIVPPVGDLVFSEAYDLLTRGLTSGSVVGKALVNGVECHHLAFTTPLVDWQIWIADGDEPLPLRYVLTTMDDPAFPQYTVAISDWNLSPEISAGTFEFTPPEGAKEVEFIRLQPAPSAND